MRSPITACAYSLISRDLTSGSLAVGMMRSLKLMEEGKKRERKLWSLNVCRIFLLLYKYFAAHVGTIFLQAVADMLSLSF